MDLKILVLVFNFVLTHIGELEYMHNQIYPLISYRDKNVEYLGIF